MCVTQTGQISHATCKFHASNHLHIHLRMCHSRVTQQIYWVTSELHARSEQIYQATRVLHVSTEQIC